MTFIKKILWNNCFFSKWKYIVEKYKIVCYNEHIKKKKKKKKLCQNLAEETKKKKFGLMFLC